MPTSRERLHHWKAYLTLDKSTNGILTYPLDGRLSHQNLWNYSTFLCWILWHRWDRIIFLGTVVPWSGSTPWEHSSHGLARGHITGPSKPFSVSHGQRHLLDLGQEIEPTQISTNQVEKKIPSIAFHLLIMTQLVMCCPISFQSSCSELSRWQNWKNWIILCIPNHISRVEMLLGAQCHQCIHWRITLSPQGTSCILLNRNYSTFINHGRRVITCSSWSTHLPFLWSAVLCKVVRVGKLEMRCVDCFSKWNFIPIGRATGSNRTCETTCLATCFSFLIPPQNLSFERHLQFQLKLSEAWPIESKGHLVIMVTSRPARASHRQYTLLWILPWNLCYTFAYALIFAFNKKLESENNK